jgi:hypothetical protein
MKMEILKSAIISVVLCSCETWFLTFSYGPKLRSFVKRALRIIFRPKIK